MPVRKIPISNRSITGQHAMGPGRRSIGFESTLERDFISLMTFEPDVTNIEEQPVRIDFTDPQGGQHHYTPDFLVHRRNALPLLVEIKPKKFLTPDLEPKFNAARQYASDRGWVFQVWTESKLRTVRLDNVHFLSAYRHRPADPGRAARILRRIETDGPMSGEDLLAVCWTDKTERLIGLGVLWQLVATGQLQTDLDQELTPQSVLHGARRIS